MNRIIYSCVIMFVLLQEPSIGSGQTQPSFDDLRAEVDSLAKTFLTLNQGPAFSIQVVIGSDTVIADGYGTADLEQGVSASAATLYQIASVTKQFTAAGVMRLVEEGRVYLDAPIAAYIPDVPVEWRRVTIRQLLNHTSGVPSFTDVGVPWRERLSENPSPDELIDLTAAAPLNFAPGSAYRYNNSGYTVLGILIERVGGQPFGPWLEENLLRPLGLEHTYYCDSIRILPGRAPGYEPDAAGWRHSPAQGIGWSYAHAGLCSTVGDLSRWNLLLAAGEVVNGDSYAAMTTPEGPAQPVGMGFGLALDTLSERVMIYHGGGWSGFSTANAYFPSDSVSVTVLSNSTSTRARHILETIARAALDLPIDWPQTRISLSEAELERYSGVYNLNGERTRVYRQGATLNLSSGSGVHELIPFGDHTFGHSSDPFLAQVVFSLEGQSASALALVVNGLVTEAPRMEE